jgi:hypothetical protein
MSCFVVDLDTLAHCVVALRRVDWRYYSEGSVKDRAIQFSIGHNWEVEAIGAELMRVNVASVIARYGDRITKQERADYAAYIRGIASGMAGFAMTVERAESIHDVQAMKSLQCWMYQACESDACTKKPVYRMAKLAMAQLAIGLVQKTPAYDAAAWG